MSQLDPNDFIITRKRKKYRFALFANSPLCYELESWQIEPCDVVELGAGTGLFSVELASRYPNKSFVAIDVKADRLQKGAREAEVRGLSNIKFLRARADQLKDCFMASSVGQIWLTFPDPFPRERSAKHRLTHAAYLDIYKELLVAKGNLSLKHDNTEFFQWSLEQLVSCGWQIKELSFDLHSSDLSDDYKILTTYERRWLGEGLKTQVVKSYLPT